LSYSVKLLIFFLLALGVLFAFDVGNSALNTLSRLNVVEAEREQWQRPANVLQALDVRPGNTVADLGCGSGYFTLKLSSAVGRTGLVLAEDIRRLPLVFLWLRTLGKGKHNISIIHGEPDDPEFPVDRVNEVLIANTYHELTDPQRILAHVRQSLVAGGRLVVVDRAPAQANGQKGEIIGHNILASHVENELRQAQFEIVRRQDHFIENDPYHENWWLIVARKP
jgi:ubiquinone/menaquinone biosynthesis C-methylase UbiE